MYKIALHFVKKITIKKLDKNVFNENKMKA